MDWTHQTKLLIIVKVRFKNEISNLEKLDIFGNIKFDFIIMNNVLEHLRDPISIIKKSKIFLKKWSSFYRSSK